MSVDSFRVAILVPTKGRPEFIRRMLGYYESLAVNHPIYIGDASETGVATQLSAFIATLKITVKYFHLQNLNADQAVHILAQEALNDKIDYCVFQGDDDWIIPSSLELAAKFLSSNPQYSTSHGRGASIILDRPGPKGRLASLGNYGGVNKIEEESALARLRNIADHYYVLYFSTHRTVSFVEICKKVLSLEHICSRELMISYCSALQGRSKFLDCLYLIRQSHTANQHNYEDWLVGPDGDLEIQRMLHLLTAMLVEVDRLPFSEAEEESKKILKSLRERRARASAKTHDSCAWKNRMQRMRSKLPKWIKSSLRRLISSPRDLRIMYSRKSVYYAQFTPVLDSITFDEKRNFEKVTKSS